MSVPNIYEKTLRLWLGIDLDGQITKVVQTSDGATHVQVINGTSYGLTIFGTPEDFQALAAALTEAAERYGAVLKAAAEGGAS
jgi:hypothetical protein